MSDYRPVLYHRTLSLESRRLRRVACALGAEIDFRDVLISRRHRREYEELGEQRLPCLVLGATVVAEAEEIIKYLRLRYGRDSRPGG